MMEKLAVIMPVYNEEDAVGPVLDKWVAALDLLKIDYTINPYNDGSKDKSYQVIENQAAQYPGKVVAHTKKNSGHGPTILQGYREAAAAEYDWVFQIDSDDEMGPDGFAGLWNAREQYDFLVGIRDGRKQALPRKIISFVSRLCVRLFYGKSVWDVNTPYRLMRVSSFKEIWEKIPSDTFAPNVIISGMAARKKMRCFETRIPQHDRQTGEVSIKKWKLFKAAAKSFWQTISFSLSQKKIIPLLKKIRFSLLLVFGILSIALLSFIRGDRSYVEIETNKSYSPQIIINGYPVKMEGAFCKKFIIPRRITLTNLQISTSSPSAIKKVFFATNPFFITYLNTNHMTTHEKSGVISWNKKQPSLRFFPVAIVFIITFILAVFPFLLHFLHQCRKCSFKFGIFITILSFFAFLNYIKSFSLFAPPMFFADSAVFQTISTLLLKGNVLYRDVFDHKGPLLYFINVIGLLLGNRWGLFVIEFFMLITTLFFLYKTVIILSGKKVYFLYLVPFFCIFIVLPFSGGNLSEEYALPFIAIGNYFMFDLLKNKAYSRASLFWIGFCSGAICLLRCNMVGISITLGIVMLAHCIKIHSWRLFMKCLLWCGIGFFIICLPFFCYALYYHAIDDFLYANIFFNIAYAKGIGGAGLSNVFGNVVKSGLYFWIPFVIYVVLLLKERSHITVFLGLEFLFYFLLTFTPASYYHHYMMVFAIPATIALCLLCDSLGEMSRFYILLSFGYVVSLCIMIPQGIYKQRMKKLDYYQMQKDTVKIKDMVSAKEDSTILTIGNDCNSYLLLQQYPNLTFSKYIYQIPIYRFNPDVLQDTILSIVHQSHDFVLFRYSNLEDDRFYRPVLAELLRHYDLQKSVGEIKIFAKKHLEQ